MNIAQEAVHPGTGREVPDHASLQAILQAIAQQLSMDHHGDAWHLSVVFKASSPFSWVQRAYYVGPLLRDPFVDLALQLGILEWRPVTAGDGKKRSAHEGP